MNLNRKIIIFGASSDIAKPIISKLSKDNELICISRSELLYENTKNITLENYNDSLIEKVSVINFIGSMILKPLHLLKENEMLEIMDVNFMTNYRILSQILKKNLSDLNYIAFSSVAANYGLANHEAIASAKAANEGLIRSCASSYGHKSYKFNCIAPSLIETKLTSRIVGTEAGRKAVENMNPLKKIGSPEDLSECITWLLSDNSNFVTGQTINIGGGLNNINSRIVQ
jgi:3-oxoacyl-[acyl-carrier protein] reductase